MKRIQNKKQYINLIFVLLILLLLTIVFSITIGSSKISFINSFKVVLSKIPILNNLINTSNIPQSSIIIISNIRLPRILLAGIVGLSLASSGAVYQGILRNSMADPYILGVSSGAALGATIAIITNFFDVKIFAFVTSITTTLFIYFISRNSMKKNNTSLILTGINTNYFITAIISLLMILHREQLDKIVYWTMGSLTSSTWKNVIISIFTVLPSFIAISIFGKYINAISVNEDFAKSVGINIVFVKKILIILISLNTSICVSISGIIGFVGLMIPHIVKILFTSDYRYLVSLSRHIRCNIFNYIRQYC